MTYDNVCTFGRNPTPDAKPVQWKPFELPEENYAQIGNDGITMKLKPSAESYKFVTSLVDKYPKAFLN